MYRAEEVPRSPTVKDIPVAVGVIDILRAVHETHGTRYVESPASVPQWYIVSRLHAHGEGSEEYRRLVTTPAKLKIIRESRGQSPDVPSTEEVPPAIR